jgi:uncharacterized membrane protein YphA (DoxX/SURF4 family)
VPATRERRPLDPVPPDPIPPDPSTDDHRGVSRRGRWQPWVSTVLRLGLGGVAIAAGLSKLGDLPASVRAVRAYELFPEPLAQLIGNGLPMVELVLGILLILGLFTRAASIVFGALMVAFIIGIASAWARGLAIDCGCFGGGGAVEPDQTRYPVEIARDLAFVIGSAVLARWPRSLYSLDHTLGLQR